MCNFFAPLFPFSRSLSTRIPCGTLNNVQNVKHDSTHTHNNKNKQGYRHNRRKSSLLSTGTSGTMKKNLKKKPSDDTEIDNEKAMDADNSGSARKRKRIVCIAVSLVLSLVFASIFIVIFTLSYSSITQASDSKRPYSFAPGPGNRDMPIHHHNGNCNNFQQPWTQIQFIHLLEKVGEKVVTTRFRINDAEFNDGRWCLQQCKHGCVVARIAEHYYLRATTLVFCTHKFGRRLSMHTPHKSNDSGTCVDWICGWLTRMHSIFCCCCFAYYCWCSLHFNANLPEWFCIRSLFILNALQFENAFS